MDFYQEVKKDRATAQRWVYVGIGLILYGFGFLLFWQFGRVRLGIIPLVVTEILLGICGHVLIQYGLLLFRQVFRTFAWHRILPLCQKLSEKNSAMRWFVPRRWVFWTSLDLEKLENRVCEDVQSFYWRLERKRQLARWDPRNRQLEAELVEVIDRYELALADRTTIIAIWNSLSRRSEVRKRFIQRVQAFLAHHEFRLKFEANQAKPISIVDNEVKVSEEDWRLKLLDSLAQECEAPEAKQLYNRAEQETNRRVKLRLLGQAISVERRIEEKAANGVSPEVQMPTRFRGKAKEVKLDQILEERFQITVPLPPKVDARMVKEIILELVDPGTRLRRWRTEVRLRQKIQQRYEIWIKQPLDPRILSQTLAWLVSIGVVVSEPAHGNIVHYVPRNTKTARNETAKQLLQTIVG